VNQAEAEVSAHELADSLDGGRVIQAGMGDRLLARMAGLELGWRLHAAESLAWLVTVLALVMSYRAETDLGLSLTAFRGWPAYVWPLSVDLADVALIVLYLEYKRVRLSTWKVGLGLLAATAVMIAANVRSAWPDPTAVLMQAWVPAVALWLWHTLAGGRKPRGAPVDLASVWHRVRPEAAPPALTTSGRNHPEVPPTSAAPSPSTAPPNRPARVPARAEVRRLINRHGAALTAEQVARRTGVSIQHANRLIRQERALHVVGRATEQKGE
jgi:hypothetical protein